VESHGALKQIAVSFNKIANDIRMLASGPTIWNRKIHIPEKRTRLINNAGKSKPYAMRKLVWHAGNGNDAAITVGGMQGQYELNFLNP
jgi:fumarate hydratase class II